MKVAGVRFRRRELLDFGVAWVALSVAFAIFLNHDLLRAALRGGGVTGAEVAGAVAVAGLTVGVGFLLHELGHKVVAIHYDQQATFHADYGMLGIAIVAALAGWLFAAPGAVRHRGRITPRENGLIALAGPAVNLLLAVLFVVLATLGTGRLAGVARLGVVVNLLLAGFNMLPVGPLDGRTVLSWSPVVYLLAAAATIGPAVVVLFDVAV